MSGCGNANCSCGSSCSCGSGCNCRSGGGYKMYPGLSEEKSTTTQTVIMDLAPAHAKGEFEEGASSGSENGGCPCGDNCKCNPCNCK